ncbi:MAG: dihydroorotase [Lachnospiraceae bacterium]|nr:dihydroorotase [Lachnospiraceae bacterium]
MGTILIKNGLVFDTEEKTTSVKDVLVENGFIKAIAENITEKADKVINADGLWVTPGFIDLHTHLREPGLTHKETIITGAASAAKGGFTTICAMPNTKPVIHNADVVNYITEKAKDAVSNVLPIGAITIDQTGSELADIKGMKDAGICALSEDGKSVLSAKKLKDAMIIAKELDIPVFSHCEDMSLVDGGCINEGVASKLLGLKGISDDSESTIVARDIVLAESTDSVLHICHISTEQSIQLVKEAQARGVKVTAEACPHHFSLCDEFITTADTNTKMNPPLRSRENMEAVKKGLKEGTISVIATDHAPHTAEEKATDYAKAPFGIVGFETALSLGITSLVKSGVLTPIELIEKMTINPARIIRSAKGNLKSGLAADIVIIDPDEVYTVKCDEFASLSKNSPFDGFELTGRVKHTILNGKLVVENSKLL